VAQYRVRVDGRFVARVDLAWPDQRLAFEYEGLWHGEQQQVVRDRTRLDALTRAGWRVVFVTAADLRDPERLVARMAEALASPRFA
jgi:very-short-patch-repair endonuclease